MLLNLAILFITISILIQIAGSFISTIGKDSKPTDYLETIWDTLILLAWAVVIKNLF